MEKTVKKILCCEIHQETLDIYRVLMVNLKKFHTAVNGKSTVSCLCREFGSWAASPDMCGNQESASGSGNIISEK